MGVDVRTGPKHQHIYETVRERIMRGFFRPGERMPPDIDLVKEFGVSRPTVAKALQELERNGFVQRKVGAGTFVLHAEERGKCFGVVVPHLGEAEIFEPICGELARLSQVLDHALLWGSSHLGVNQDKEELCRDLCNQCIRRKVDGVFFAPLEFSPNKDRVNDEVIKALDAAGMPVVLLDRDYRPYPERSNHDLVGVDNRRVGFALTNLLFTRGCRKILFVAKPASASTVDARIAGFMEAVVKDGGAFDSSLVQRCDPRDEKLLAKVIKQQKPDGFVCGNDVTAGILMHSLANLDVRVPEDVLVAGIDDVKYAELLRVPLTSVRQPCKAIGDAAMHTMLHRLQYRNAPVRDVLLGFELVERKSTTPIDSAGTQ
jgi:GntR family transcriptional regulator, arabinose operon transcriptional repressor